MGNIYVSSTTSTTGPPYDSTSRQSGTVSIPDLERKDQGYKRVVRVLRFISRIVSLILNAVTIGILSWSLEQWYTTHNRIIDGGAHPWGTTTKLWPTYMLLGIAATTFLMNIITLGSYICGVQAANKSATATTVVSTILLAVHVVAWAVATGLFKMANTGNDLWGYSCSPTADEIQIQVQSYLDFNKLCNFQGGAWYASIIQSITYGLTFSIMFVGWKRLSHQKKMRKVRESMATEAGFNQNLEMGDVYSPGIGKS